MMALNVNRISMVIPQADLDDALGLIEQGYNKLKPYLIEALSKEEMEGYAKLGEKSEPFVDKGIEFAKNSTPLVPRRCNIPESEKDFNVFEVLRPHDVMVAQLALRISQTRIVAGAEALDCINDFYKSVKQDAEDGIAEAKPIYEELKKRYASVGKYDRKAIKTNQ
jgi:hypothetical protein